MGLIGVGPVIAARSSSSSLIARVVLPRAHKSPGTVLSVGGKRTDHHIRLLVAARQTEQIVRSRAVFRGGEVPVPVALLHRIDRCLISPCIRGEI